MKQIKKTNKTLYKKTNKTLYKKTNKTLYKKTTVEQRQKQEENIN